MSNRSVFPIEQIVSTTVPEHVRIAPDGETVVYVRGQGSKAGDHPVSDLWKIDTRTGTEQRLTSGDWLDSEPAVSPCGRYPAFISDRAEPGTPQIWLLSLGGGEAVQITDDPGIAHGPLWSPDGRTLAYLFDASDDEEERQRKEDEGDQWEFGEKPKRSHIRVIEIGDQVETLINNSRIPDSRQISPSDIHVATMMLPLYCWLPDSSGFAAVIAESPYVDHLWFSELGTISLDGEVRRLGSWTGLFSPPSASPDGSQIAFIGAGQDPASIGVLYVIPAAGGEARALAATDNASAGNVVWLQDSRRLLVNIVTSLQSDLLIVDSETGQVESRVNTGDRPGTIIGAPSIDRSGEYVAFIRADSASQLEVWTGAISGNSRPRTDLNPWIRDYPVGDVRELSWSSSDGQTIHGLLYLPVGYQEGARYPLLTHIHGGPMGAWTHRFYCSWHDWAQPMAQRGYAVLMPNPRGSGGRGAGWLAANRNDLGGLEWDDIETGVDEVIRLGIADPDQLVIGGWSYGGYFTNWAITHSNRFKAAVTGASISNWVSFNSTTDVGRMFDTYFPHPVYENADRQWERSPVRYLSAVSTPTLVVHGEADIRVPIGQSYEMYFGLRERGVDSKFVIYPREPHQITERKHQADLLRRTIEWFDHHLGRTKT